MTPRAAVVARFRCPRSAAPRCTGRERQVLRCGRERERGRGRGPGCGGGVGVEGAYRPGSPCAVQSTRHEPADRPSPATDVTPGAGAQCPSAPYRLLAFPRRTGSGPSPGCMRCARRPCHWHGEGCSRSVPCGSPVTARRPSAVTRTGRRSPAPTEARSGAGRGATAHCCIGITDVTRSGGCAVGCRAVHPGSV